MAWDSEGSNFPDGSHRLTLVANSRGDYLMAAEGLEPEQVVEWIVTKAGEAGRAIHVGYAFSYDVNMILRGCPREFLEQVWAATDQPVSAGKGDSRRLLWWRRLGVRWVPRHLVRFGFREGYGAGKDRLVSRGSVLIYDVFGFFQCSFLAALRRWGVVPPDLSLIEQGKAKRSLFRPEEVEEQLPYCLAECRALVSLMDALRAALQEAGLEPGSWHGPGAVADRLMTREGVDRHLGQLTPRAKQPGGILEWWRRADYGGRIELIQYGHHRQPGWVVDLGSAYPWALSKVPSMTGGEWIDQVGSLQEPRRELGELTSRPDFTLVMVDWSLKPGAAFYPFPYRTPHGAIYFPPSGRAVVWLPEWEAAREGLRRGVWQGTVEMQAWATFVPQTDNLPFGFVPEMYEHRRSLKVTSPGRAVVEKLAMNSLYGKLCQQVGGTEEEPPRWFQLAWAGWVCSMVRARLLRLAIRDPEAVVAFMTDGIQLTRLPRERYSTDLGRWEPQPFSELISINSGVYFWRTPEGELVSHFRGFDPPSRLADGRSVGLTPELVLEGYRRGDRSVSAPSTRFVQMGVALQTRWELFGSWHSGPRTLDLLSRPGGAKRWVRTGRRPPRPDLRLCRTEAETTLETSLLLSAPMPLRWRDQAAEHEEIREWEDSFA